MGGKSRKSNRVNKKLLDRIASIKKNKLGKKSGGGKNESAQSDAFDL